MAKEYCKKLIPNEFYRHYPDLFDNKYYVICRSDENGVLRDKNGEVQTLVMCSRILNLQEEAKNLRQKATELNEDAEFLEEGLVQLTQSPKKRKESSD